MSLIVSSIPGRLRLRARDLDPEQAAALPVAIEAIAALPGVREVTDNPRTTSVLIHYDPRILSQTSMETAVLTLLGADDEIAPAASAATEEAGVEATKMRPPQTTWRSHINRGSKLGTMAAMTVSLLALLARYKRVHARAGILALVFVSVHLYIQRRRLLR